MDLPRVERLQAVEIRPGDIIVATLSEDTDDADVEEIRKRLPEALGVEPDRVVMVQGFEIEVHRHVGLA